MVAASISKIAVIAVKAFQKSKRSDLDMKITSRFRMASIGLAAAAFTAAGCSSMQPFVGSGGEPAASTQASAATTPPPRVQDCAIVNITSPNQFYCKGKVYTSFQLTKLREDWAKDHPDYDSGFFFQD
jgi:hypothetical protein